MQHLDFIVWMICFPLSVTLQEYISARKSKLLDEPKKTYSKGVDGNSALFIICIWILVGYNLF